MLEGFFFRRTVNSSVIIYLLFMSILVRDGTTNLLLCNHTNMLLVYQDVTLKWAAQLPFVPVATRLANFP